MRAFRRFCGRRGVPTNVVSDNAKTFQASSNEVQRVIRSESVQCYMTNRHIDWQFIVEEGPWWGGFWERLVKSVKRCLKKTIGRALPTYDEMATLIVEIEAILNNRPLTYMYDDTVALKVVLCDDEHVTTLMWRQTITM